MIFYVRIGYGLIVLLPACSNVKDVIWKVVTELSQIYLIYLIIITIMNIFFERKIEKRNSSKEFVFLAVLNIIILVLITSLISNEFYKTCCPGE